MKHIDHESEVDYLEFIQENIPLREDELEELRRGASLAVADNKAQQDLRKTYENYYVPNPDNPYFTRIDLKNGEIRYYGNIKLKSPVASKPLPTSHVGVDEDLLILSTLSDAAGYTADYPENLPEMVARTRLVISNGVLTKITEEFFDGDRAQNKIIAADVVEESIQQTRKKRMQPISSTLQPEQFQISREPSTNSLAIQGPPGSGKTAVLLERLARIAFADEGVYKKGMLLIGPNQPFMDYVSAVLPAFGENDISMKSIDQLSEFAKRIDAEPTESEELIYLKGSEHMKKILENLVENQYKVLSKSYFMKILAIDIEFTQADSWKLLYSLKEESNMSATQIRRVGETRVRNSLVEKFQQGWIERKGDLRTMQGDPAVLINQESTFRTILRNIFPPLDAIELLKMMKMDAQEFISASQNVIDFEEQIIWLEESEPQGAKITKYDIPMLDYLESLISDPIKKWGHIAIDEVQDLSPMEMAMVVRRLDADASVSIAGDLAQATGTQYYPTWDSVLLQLEQEYQYSQRELRRSYRVPKEILEYAQQFLDASDVDVAASEPFLALDNSLTLEEVADEKSALQRAVIIANANLQNRESTLIIASKSDRRLLAEHSFAENGNAYIRVMDPTEVKGLEFDAVVILNPDLIFQDYAWDESRFARLFYVLTTRSTKRLTLLGTSYDNLVAPLTNLLELDENGEPIGKVTKSEFEPKAITNELSDQEIKAPTVTASGLEKPTPIIPTVTILDLCSDLNIDIQQASGDFLEGHWLFAGTTQNRCPECGEKPELVFLKHVASSEIEKGSTHVFAIGCSGCSVIRNFDPTKFGDLNQLIAELAIEKLITQKCLGCGGSL